MEEMAHCLLLMLPQDNDSLYILVQREQEESLKQESSLRASLHW
ncbi:unnamed protein product [Brassica oleracea var. botrytis]